MWGEGGGANEEDENREAGKKKVCARRVWGGGEGRERNRGGEKWRDGLDGGAAISPSWREIILKTKGNNKLTGPP